MAHFFEHLAQAAEKQIPLALAIITGIKGSSPQKKGAKAIFFPDGQIIGTLGGGCLEAEIQDRARNAIRTGKPETFELVLDHDFGWDDGLICGGKVEGVILPRIHNALPLWKKLARRDQIIEWGIRSDFSIEEIIDSSSDWIYREESRPPIQLWIAGAGHIAQAVAPLAVSTDFRVTVLDDRPTLANRSNFPEPIELCVGNWDELLKRGPAGEAFGLIVTRGHRHDALVLKEWIHQPFSFLGMIGSKRKARTIREHFIAEGIASESEWNRVHCPVGLAIPAVAVSEIAISIVAQLIQARAELSASSKTTLIEA